MCGPSSWARCRCQWRSDDRIIYNPANGQILYDAGGLGGTAAVLFATLTNKPQDVDHTDFVVI